MDDERSGRLAGWALLFVALLVLIPLAGYSYQMAVNPPPPHPDVFVTRDEWRKADASVEQRLRTLEARLGELKGGAR